MSMKDNEKFWIEDPKILFCNNNYYKILPKKNMTLVQFFNCLSRILIYLLIICLVISNVTKCIYIPIIAIIMIIIIYYIVKNNKNINMEKFTQSTDNTNDDIEKNIQSTNVSDKVESKTLFPNVTMASLMDENSFSQKYLVNNQDLFKDERSFYTLPSTTIPNDQDGFARWIYRLPETCKENTNQCLRYEDIRFNR